MATIPGRASTLTHTDTAAMGAPLYGRVAISPGTNVRASLGRLACEITTIWPLEAFSHTMSSAPFADRRPRKNTGGMPGATVPTDGKVSTIFHPFTGKA